MPPNTSSIPPKPNTFRELEIIKDPDGVIAVITERVKDGRVSFMLAREFEQDGKTCRSAFMAARHLPAVRRLLADIDERLALIEDQARARRRS